MKTYILSSLIVVFIIFVTFISITYIESLYRIGLNDTYCKCKNITKTRLDEVDAGDLPWTVVLFTRTINEGR